MKCADPAGDGSRDQGARLDRVVEVVAERIGHQFRHHDRAGEVHDRVDLVLGDQPADQRLVADIALDEGRFGRNGPFEAGCKVVEDDNLLAVVDELPHHVASDVAGAAGDKYAHLGRRTLKMLPVDCPARRA